eukprot:g4194.t1
MDGHIAVLQRQKSQPFVHKELLSKIVLLMKLEDSVRAEELISSSNIEGWFLSREYQVGTDLVEAMKSNDAEALAGLQKEQIFTFLQVEVARIVKQLKAQSCFCRRTERWGPLGWSGRHSQKCESSPQSPQRVTR